MAAEAEGRPPVWFNGYDGVVCELVNKRADGLIRRLVTSMFPCEAKMPPKGTYNQNGGGPPKYCKRREGTASPEHTTRNLLNGGNQPVAALVSEATGCDVPLTPAVGRLT
ncbi:MAG: hypothetical protein ACTS4T_01420 [Candidatus Hodgkinia cicadicola]